MAGSNGEGGGFHQQVLGVLHKSVSEEERMPKQTRLGVIWDIFTGTADQLPSWLDRNRPSMISKEDPTFRTHGNCVHLEVFPGFDRSRSLVTTQDYGDKAVQRFLEEADTQRQKRGNVPDLKYLALKHRILDGKWFCFYHRDFIDDVWAKVATAVVEGQLECRRAGVALTADRDGLHLLCLYVHDYRVEQEREQAEHGFRKLLEEPRMKMVFRPLFLSYYCATVDQDFKREVRWRFKDIWSQGADHDMKKSQKASKALVSTHVIKRRKQKTAEKAEQLGRNNEGQASKEDKTTEDQKRSDLRSLAFLSVHDK